MGETLTSQVQDVFDHWVETCRSKGRKPLLGDKRKRKIAAAIRLYGADACKDAITGVTKSEFHMGKNPRGKKYDDIELILRDEKHVEMFLEHFDRASDGPSLTADARDFLND